MPAKRAQSESEGSPGPGHGNALPLPSLLSHLLVAFIVEFDNEFEHRMPHWTTDGSPRRRIGVWCTSMVMWSTCMRFVGDQGITVRELASLARTPTNLHGMTRWRYIVVRPNPADTRPRPPQADWLIHATPAGRIAQEIWPPLFGIIEERWRQRFGHAQIGQIRDSLIGLIRQFNIALPDCMPIIHYGLFSKPLGKPATVSKGDKPVLAKATTIDQLEELPLSTLLAKALLAFALEFERDAHPESELNLSLAICSNIVRILDDKGLRVRDLPQLSGVSKESIAMAIGYLQKFRYIVVESDPARRAKLVRLTPAGLLAQHAYQLQLAAIEARWRQQYGRDCIKKLRASLERLAVIPNQPSPLFKGLEPYPDGWRASVPKPETLPHFPMVLHRGGYPDGS